MPLIFFINILDDAVLRRFRIMVWNPLSYSSGGIDPTPDSRGLHMIKVYSWNHMIGVALDITI